jgi:hypothetical protein
MKEEAYIARKKGKQRECTTLSLVICSQDDDDVFDANHQSQGPDDKRKDAEKVIVRWIGGEGRRVNVKRTGSNIAIYYTSSLVREPGRKSSEIMHRRVKQIGSNQVSCHPEKTCSALAML